MAPQGSTSAADTQTAEFDSPIPRRTREQQRALTSKLLTLDTLAGRIQYLLEHESFYYMLRDEPVTDPALIDSNPRGLKRKTARVPFIAHWIEGRTGHRVSKQALYKIRDGDTLQVRSMISNTLEEFWRLEHLLLDLTVPASRFTDLTDEQDLDELEQRTYDLMSKVGLTGVRAREVKASLSHSGIENRYAFVQILEAIARDQGTGGVTD
ncbi:hypothetical protein FPZ12_008020 [Amycolatopsis acidicola]|uniref:Uncharacterized protein n=1 Tax=Amycolatopsis acidicola TaxID=2596893 RepID=A0A5N0VC45_9PSEU|nr:hypothetical protein [Amycolatopsis acidicola]KAA9163967.1 hypothetical protein FPZ12_008020 [Amycolatopsis acidicola]